MLDPLPLDKLACSLGDSLRLYAGSRVDNIPCDVVFVLEDAAVIDAHVDMQVIRRAGFCVVVCQGHLGSLPNSEM